MNPAQELRALMAQRKLTRPPVARARQRLQSHADSWLAPPEANSADY
jgi:hypothetical protein